MDKRRLIIAGVGLALLLVLAWLNTTDDIPAIWAVRNTIQYRGLRWWWTIVGEPQQGPPGQLRGRILDPADRPIAGARVLVSRWNGQTYTARTGADGVYLIRGIPAGVYRPVAGAPGYESVVLGDVWGRVKIRPHQESRADVTLSPGPPDPIEPAHHLVLSEPLTRSCAAPFQAEAIRREVRFESAGRPNQPTFYYAPLTITTSLPILLIDYPGPADTWECVSVPLAAAGYGLVAAGLAYSFEPEADVAELERLLMLARSGQFPGSDSRRVALVGGSYSGVHIFRLLQRNPEVEAGILLGAPADLFDMRHRLEEGSHIPPFGLDRAMIALGLPDREALRYWRYSGAYHVRPDFPPVAVLHSRTDEIVPYQQSELLAHHLAQEGVPHRLRLFQGASHYLRVSEGDPDSLELYRITLEFLAEYLDKADLP